MTKDQNFDVHKERFKRNIYDTPKGIIRLNILQRDFHQYIPGINDSALSILDAGCGMGQFSSYLAQKGHQLTLCDVSSEMIKQAQQLFNQEGLAADFHLSPLQDFCQNSDQQFDLVLSHAVLEWMDKPECLLESLKLKVKPGGYLSLMFYNVNAVIMFNLLKGNFRKVVKNDFTGHPGGLTPTNPIDPDEVHNWLNIAGFQLLHETGVRVIYDYLSKDLRNARSLEDIMQLEYEFSVKKPFKMLGRYLHFICQRSG